MSTNKKNLQTPKLSNNSNSDSSPFFSQPESLSSHNISTHNRIIPYSESNTKTNIITKYPNKINMHQSTSYQTFSKNKPPEENNDISIGERINDDYSSEISFSNLSPFHSNNIYSNINPSKKPRLSLKDSRTKLKELRDKLYPLTEEERIKEQEGLLPVPLKKMNDEKYKILKMHNLKKKSLPEYKSCTKYDDYYKPFEKSLEKKNEFYLLKKKKGVYSSTKNMVLEFNLKNKNKEKNFPLYKDQDIGIYEYWQVPLIESKIDEDNDSDDEQIKLATNVCHLDLKEGIHYVQNNGIDDIINRHIKQESQISNKSMSI